MSTAVTVPSTRSLVALVAMLAIVSAFVLALYALTDPAARPELLGRLVTFGPAAIVAVPAVLAWLSTGALTRQTQAQSETLDQQSEQLTTIARQTNGELTARMVAVVSEQLDARGLIPQQTSGDHVTDVAVAADQADAVALAATDPSPLGLAGPRS